MSSVDDSKKQTSSAEPQQAYCGDWYTAAEKCARQEPMKCTAIAFLAGFLFTILPVGQVLGAIVRLVLSLIRPALVLLGAMKVFEEFEKRRER